MIRAGISVAVVMACWIAGCGGGGKRNSCEDISLGAPITSLEPRTRTEPSFGAEDLVKARADWTPPTTDGGTLYSCDPATCGEHYSLGGQYVGFGCGKNDEFKGDEFQYECAVYVIDGGVAAVARLCVY